MTRLPWRAWGFCALYSVAVLLALLGNGVLFGQGFTASVLGVVSDASGAVMSQVPVTATNVDTGVKTVAITDERGNYTILHLQPGSYRVAVEVTGFKSEIVGPLTLQVDQRQALDFKLELGQVTDSVNVTPEATQIQAETATVGGVVTNAQTSELPLNGRNFLELNLLLPGAAQPVKGSQLSTQGGSIEVHGMPENSNYFWVDGLDNTTQTIGQYIVNSPAYSIAEFRVMSPTYDAEFGRTPGANINVITRSGGNSYHGDVYLFIRNSYFDAKNYFDPAGSIPAFRRGQYGGDIGGKVLKDKLFFYGAFEGLTFAQGETAKNIVPTHQETLGDFSDMATVIKDPATGLPFKGNVIPKNQINATGLAIAALYPAPNSGTNTLLVSPTGTDRDNVYVAKADWIISAKDRFSAYWAFEDVTFNQPIAQFSANTNIPGFGLTQLAAHDFTTGLSETHTFSPTLLSVVKFGWNRYEFNYFPYARYQDWCAVLAIQGCDEGQSNWNMPGVSLNSVYSSLGGAANQTEPGPFDTTFINPTITKIKGRHTLKAGWDFHHFFTNFGNGEGPRGTFTFNGKWTGSPLADLLLGLPYQATKTVISIMPNNGHFLMDMRSTAGFIQDDYQLSSRLTLNLGLRYEYNFPATERRNYMANLDLSQGLANAVLQVAGQNGVGSTLYSADAKQFAPRIGFAYSPAERWVVRGGYGIFYQLNLENTSQGLHYDTPFSNAYTIIGDGKTVNINDALVTGLVANVPAFSAMAHNYKAGMIQQYSFGFQHELPRGILLDASYVGNRGRSIDAPEPINTPTPGPGSVQARRPNVNYAGITLTGPFVSSEYDGLEVRATKHFSHGASVLFSYTWSRAFDNTGTPQDPRNLPAQWGPSTFDIPSHISLSYVYPLPVGRNGVLLNHMNSVGEAFLGGWQLNGIYQYHSGQTFTPILAFDNTNTLLNQDRPNLIGDPFQSTATCHTRTPGCWMNVAAFATPAPYTFGNAGKDEVRGPTFNQLDFATSKNFSMGEGKRVEIRAEAFNLLNHPNFDNPGATMSSSFGIITTAEPSRQMQFGGRFVF
jgi:hypothetical protein